MGEGQSNALTLPATADYEICTLGGVCWRHHHILPFDFLPGYYSAASFVSWSFCHRESQTWWFKTKEIILTLFWRPGDRDEIFTGPYSFWGLVLKGESFLAPSRFWSPSRSFSCGPTTPIPAFSIASPSPPSVSSSVCAVCPSAFLYKDTRHWISVPLG